jgi:uracil-DNA glycosylase
MHAFPHPRPLSLFGERGGPRGESRSLSPDWRERVGVKVSYSTSAHGLETLRGDIVECSACPRLVDWREQVAREKRKAYASFTYWGRPVPGFGDPEAKIVILGLAPGAHGANRTGRVFTGDRSGDFLFAALERAGLANQATSTGTEDGLVLRGAYILVAVRCVPPGNLPTVAEIARCESFLDRELALLRSARVVLALGAIAWRAYVGYLRRRGHPMTRAAPRFGHGAHFTTVAPFPQLRGSYHVSQQNTQTGKLTSKMFDEVLSKARESARAR